MKAVNVVLCTERSGEQRASMRTLPQARTATRKEELHLAACFGRWEETGEPRGNDCIDVKNTQKHFTVSQ